MTGGIQLVCERLVRNSRFSYDVVTLSAPNGSRTVPTMPGVIRTPRLAGHSCSIGYLNGLTVAHALARHPDAVVSAHVVAGPGALAVQGLLRAPAVQLLHASELSARPKLTHLVTQRASASIAVSSYTRLQALAMGAPADRVHVINPGVDPRIASTRPGSSDPASENPTLITVARLEDRYKGFDVLIRALPLIRARVPNVRWVLVGGGSLRDELQAMAGAFDVADCITFAGAVDDTARDEWLDRSDVFAMPSRLMPSGVGGEGFGIVYLEAGAHGLPCVAGNVGGAVDAVIDGTTGILVDPTDHVAVANVISMLLTNRNLAARMGKAGRERAAAQSWERMVGEVDDLVERVVAERRAHRHV
jgi:phosphatidylinositol alpha-1,6-mannosyltransferase